MISKDYAKHVMVINVNLEHLQQDAWHVVVQVLLP
jgi:hypothetical protein